MKMYKKMVRFYSSFYGGMGFKDEIKPITDWIEEDKISEEDKKKIEEVENNLWTDLIKKEDYIFAKEED
jgi:hypothetical protein